MSSLSYTLLIALWHGHNYTLPAQAVESPLACYTQGQQIFADWAKSHPGARLVKWGCVRRQERSA